MDKVTLVIFDPGSKGGAHTVVTTPSDYYLCRVKLASKGYAYLISEELYNKGVRHFLFLKEYPHPLELVGDSLKPAVTQEEFRRLLDTHFLVELARVSDLSWSTVGHYWSSFFKSLLGLVAMKLSSLLPKKKERSKEK